MRRYSFQRLTRFFQPFATHDRRFYVYRLTKRPLGVWCDRVIVFFFLEFQLLAACDSENHGGAIVYIHK